MLYPIYPQPYGSGFSVNVKRMARLPYSYTRFWRELDRAGKAAGLRTVAALFGYREAAALRAEGADQYWTAFGVAEA